MSEDHDLKQDLTTDVRLNSQQKRNDYFFDRSTSQNQRHFNGFSRRRHRDEGQPVPLLLNGHHNQRHGDRGSGQPPNQHRGKLFDPVIREQRRLFYQSHYQNRNQQQNGMKQSSNYSHRNRSFRNRNVQPNGRNDAQCDNKKKDERPVRLENGSADPGSQTCLPESSMTEGPVNHLDRADRNRQQQRSAGSRNASHPPLPPDPQHEQQYLKQSEERGTSGSSGKAVRRHRSDRSRRTKKQSPVAEAKDLIPEKVQEVCKEAEVDKEEEEADEEETKCCPLCTEPLDPTESNLYPCCFCKFQICLFCLNRLKQEETGTGTEAQPVVDQSAESQKRVCGSCPGCRNPYPADSDDESMLIAVRATKKQTKAAGTERTGNRNRNTNSKQETRTTTAVNAEKSENRTPGNRSHQLLTQAKRPPHDDHHKHQGKEPVNYRSEKDCSRPAVDRFRTTTSSNTLPSHSRPVRVRGPGRRQQRTVFSSRGPDRAADQKQDAASIKQESKDEKKQELVSLLSSLGLSPCNIHFHPQRQES